MSSIDVVPGTIVLLRCSSDSLINRFFTWIIHGEKAEEYFSLYFKKDGIPVVFLNSKYHILSFDSIIKKSIVQMFDLEESLFEDDRNLDLTLDEPYTFSCATPQSKFPTYRDVYNDLTINLKLTSPDAHAQMTCDSIKGSEVTRDSAVIIVDWKSVGECLCMRRNFENVVTVDVHDPDLLDEKQRSFSFISDVLAQPSGTKLSHRDTVNYY